MRYRCSPLFRRALPLLPAALLMVLVFWPAAPSLRAQPAAERPAPQPKGSRSATPFSEMYNRIRRDGDKDPAPAVQAALEFLRAHPQVPQRDQGVAAGIYREVAQIQAGRLKDVAGALVTLDEAIQANSDTPQEFNLVVAKSEILSKAGREDEALAFLSKEWPRLSQLDSSVKVSLLYYYAGILNRQNKPAQALKLVQEFAAAQPGQLLATEKVKMTRNKAAEPVNAALIKLLIEQLRGSGQVEQALRWAKLNFVLAPYDEKALRTATQTLSELWAAQDAAARTQELAEAMQDPAKPNPLRAIKLPEFDPEALAQQATTAQNPPERISVSLLSGDTQGAMIEAQRMVLSAPTAPAGLLEVCRVFKARDLNLKRANAFLDYMKTGEGVNPVTEFLKEK